MRIELEDLPKLRDIFHRLQSGYHLSNEDFGLYHELQDKEAYYEALFRDLGYTLKSDQRGFYYFLPEMQFAMNATTRKMALIMFLLVEHLADEGHDPYARVMKHTFDTEPLAEALFQKHAGLLVEGGLLSPDAVIKCILNSFAGLGFATAVGDKFHFRPPVSRFLDVCLELGSSGTNGNGETEEIDHAA